MIHPIILIPARLASARLPHKPLAMIGDAPMIVQVWRRAVASGLARVAVACDSEAIAEAVHAAGGEAVLTDPSLPSGSDRIWAALQQLDPAGAHDIVINLQGDMPTLDPAIVGKAMQPLITDPQLDIATLASPIRDAAERDNPAVVKIALTGTADDPTRHALYFSRSVIPYGAAEHYHHIGIYAYRRTALERFVALPPSPLEQTEKLEQLRALEAGMRIGVAVVDTVPLGVDTPEQLEEARRLIAP